jgi:hypothetical protein
MPIVPRFYATGPHSGLGSARDSAFRFKGLSDPAGADSASAAMAARMRIEKQREASLMSMQKDPNFTFPIVFASVAARTGRRDGTHAASDFEKAVATTKELAARTMEARRLRSNQAGIGTALRSTLRDPEAPMWNTQADLLRAEYDRSGAVGELARLTGRR